MKNFDGGDKSFRRDQYAILEGHDSAVGIVDANDLIGAL